MITLANELSSNGKYEKIGNQVSEIRKKNLISKCKAMKRYSINFFNTKDRTDIRLRTGEHSTEFRIESKKLSYCIYSYATRSTSKRISRTS